ncbi:MAG: hypothetical protein JXO49_10375 [Deltaproteobacteria bacterium]|nr:hypothetical protein [Candidatus Anaeroferrophillus wilburensis]MBN2889736.1 hypothetical protein [Deltaproteobacteria bacterium]
MSKELIRQYAMDVGADVVGFAAIADYNSPLSPAPQNIMPDVQSLVVTGYRENDGAVESPNKRISMASRTALPEKFPTVWHWRNPFVSALIYQCIA